MKGFAIKEKRSPEIWPDLVAIVVGGISATLGVVVLVGWTTHSVTLMQVLSAFSPMQYNTALGFLLCGAGFLLLVYGRPLLAIACGGMAAAFGFLTLMEVLFGIDLGVDRLITVKAFAPGRMAPNSALCLVLTGAVLLFLSLPARFGYRLMVSGIVGSIIATLGMVAFFGYLSGVETAYRWSYFTPMAVHTSSGFTVLGLGVLFISWLKARAEERSTSRWLPISFGAGVVTATFCIWYMLIAQERVLIEETVRLGTVSVKNEIERQMEDRILVLVRMAKRWGMTDEPSKETWEKDAGFLLSHHPGTRAIEWMNPSFQGRWIVHAQESPLPLEEGVQITLEPAGDRHEVTVTRSNDLEKGERGFFVSVPILQEEDFRGFILGHFQNQELLEAILPQDVLSRYSISISDDEGKIFSHFEPSSMEMLKWGQDMEVKFSGVTWRVNVWPMPELLIKLRSLLPQVTLIAGFLLAAVFVSAVYLVQNAGIRVKEVEAAHRELEDYITERKRAEEDLKVLNEALGRRISERSAIVEQRARELARSNAELERFNRLAVGREKRIIQLKRQINKLADEAGKVPPYDLSFLQEDTTGGEEDFQEERSASDGLTRANP